MPTQPQTGRSWWGSQARAWVLFIAGAAAVLAFAPSPWVHAQEPAKDAAKAEAPAAKAEEPAAAEPAKADAAPAAAGESAATPPARKSMLVWFLEAAGPIGVFLVLISVYMVQLLIRLFMEMKISEAVPPAARREAGQRDQGAKVPGSVRRLPR